MEISKWIISTRNKLKLAFALIVVAGLLLAANRFAREHVASIDQSFLSIYADRLCPPPQFLKFVNICLKNTPC